MHEEDSGGVLDIPVSPCGHRNPVSAHFCDVCGVKLPMQCPRCSASNRGQANFCSHCGSGMRDVPATELPPPPSKPFQPARQAANSGMGNASSDKLVPRTPESSKELVADEDAQRLKQIARFAQQRRRRAWVWPVTVSVSIVVGLLGAALVYTHTVMPSGGLLSSIGTIPPGRIGPSADESGSAAVVARTPASTDSSGTAVQPDRDSGSPVPVVLEKSPAVAPADRRAADKLPFVVPSELRSDSAHREETFATLHPTAPPPNNLLHKAALLPADDRHAGSVRSVGPDHLVVDEIGRAGEEQALRVTVTRTTRIIESQRNPAAADTQNAFTDKVISLAEVKKGDYVVVDASREGTKLVATSVTITLRGRPQ